MRYIYIYIYSSISEWDVLMTMTSRRKIQWRRRLIRVMTDVLWFACACYSPFYSSLSLLLGTSLGVCGKTPETAAIQDALMEVVKSLSVWCVEARNCGATPAELAESNIYTLKATFSTLTNVNFSEERIAEYIHEGMALKKQMENLVNLKGGAPPESQVADLDLASDMSVADLEEFGRSVSIPVREEKMGDADCFSLNEIATCKS